MNWTTKDGRVIPVKDMSTQHIVNAIAYIERHVDDCRCATIDAAVQVLAFTRGEQATYAIESALNQMLYDPQFQLEAMPIYRALQRERKKRLALPKEHNAPCPF